MTKPRLLSNSTTNFPSPPKVAPLLNNSAYVAINTNTYTNPPPCLTLAPLLFVAIKNILTAVFLANRSSLAIPDF
jgi:hypothetical protein